MTDYAAPMASGSGSRAGSGGTLQSSTSSNTPQSVRLSSVDDVVSAAHKLDAARSKNAAVTLVVSLDKLVHANIRKKTDVLLNPTVAGQDPLRHLDPAQHTIAYAYILAHRATVAVQNLEAGMEMVPFIDGFVATFDVRQGHFASAKVTQVARAIVGIGSKGAINPNWTLSALAMLFGRFTDPYPSTLTSLHPIFLSHCAQTRQYDLAQKNILARPILTVDRNVSSLTAIDVIDYFFLAGFVRCELSQWQEAAEMFESVLLVPVARAAHDRQVDAARRLLLVQLIKDGKTSPRPNLISDSIINRLRVSGRPYKELAELYASSDRHVSESDLREMANRHAEAFQEDQTTGLVNYALSVYHRRKIQRLETSFTQLRIADIIQLLSLKREDETDAAVETRVTQLIQDMVNTNQLNASYDTSSSTLSFLPSSSTEMTSSNTTLSSIETLTTNLKVLNQLNAYIETQEREIASSKPFLSRQLQSQSQQSQAFGSRRAQGLSSAGMTTKGFQDDVPGVTGGGAGSSSTTGGAEDDQDGW
ncbi:unnamed protein product [Sympodiomycopsis kandeliae]